MQDTRIYSLKKDINSKNVQNFYNSRSKMIDSDLHAVMLQPKNSRLPIQRDEFEKNIILNNLTFKKNSKILDIGCGVGRIATIIPNEVKYYGLDFTEEFINIAKQKFQDNNNFTFHHVDITNFQNYQTLHEKKFNIIFIVGILIYLNDSVIEDILNNLLKFLNKNKILQVYIRESISLLEERLTLDNFYSDTLEDDYSAIYRTDQEYKDLFKIFEDIGLYLSKELLFPEALGHHQETRQKLYILKKR